MTYDLTPFKLWLQSKSYSDPTVRNYVADTNKYLTFVIASEAKQSQEVIFSSTSLSAYINQLTPKTYAQRALASLSKFCQFALDQKIISSNPFNNINRQLASTKRSGEGGSYQSFDSILDSYKIYLTNHHKSESTITNYINDIKQFINFAQKFET